MYRPPEPVDAQTFKEFADAADRIWPPHSKRLRVSAHSDFHTDPFRFQVKWQQPAYFLNESGNIPYSTVSVNVPVIKPIAPGSMKVQLLEVKNLNSQEISTTDTSNNFDFREASSSIADTVSTYWPVYTRDLAEGPYAPSGGVTSQNVFIGRNKISEILSTDTGDSQVTVRFGARNHDVDPSMAEHPRLTANGGTFTFDIFSQGGWQFKDANRPAGPFDFEATFVVFPDPYWSKN